MRSLLIKGITTSDLCLGMSMFGTYCPFMNIKGVKIKDCKGMECKTQDDIYECLIKNDLVEEIESQ